MSPAPIVGDALCSSHGQKKVPRKNVADKCRDQQFRNVHKIKETFWEPNEAAVEPQLSLPYNKPRHLLISLQYCKRKGKTRRDTSRPRH